MENLQQDFPLCYYSGWSKTFSITSSFSFIKTFSTMFKRTFRIPLNNIHHNILIAEYSLWVAFVTIIAAIQLVIRSIVYIAFSYIIWNIFSRTFHMILNSIIYEFLALLAASLSATLSAWLWDKHSVWLWAWLWVWLCAELSVNVSECFRSDGQLADLATRG